MQLYGAAVREGAWDAARDAARALLVMPIDDEERGAMLRSLHDISRFALDDADGATAVLLEALAVPAASAWAPDVARLRAAAAGDAALLARAARGARRARDRRGGGCSPPLCRGARAPACRR